MRLFALTCGWLTGPAGLFLAGERGRLRVPVPAYLIDHPHGLVLFDSGLHPAAGADPAGRLGAAANVFQVHFAAGEDVAARLAALERGDIAADAFDPLERAVLRFTTEVVRDVRASEATFAALAQHLSAQEIVELIVTVGYYMMIARLLETTAVDLDPPAGTKVVDAIR